MTEAPTDVLRIALDVPLRRLFDYRAPSGEPLPAGIRVRVPFGRRRLVGIVMSNAKASELPLERVKSLLEVIDAMPVLDADAVGMLEWAAEYYHHPIGEVIASALPKALRLGVPAPDLEERWSLTAEGRAALAAQTPRRAPVQRQLLELIDSHGEASPEALDRERPGWRSIGRVLERRGWARRAQRPRQAPATPATVRQAGPPLNAHQEAAFAAIAASLGRFGAFVLHGVTGSGKTEVYFRLIERALERGEGTLLLVPEIGLTPQLVGRFAERFDAPLAVLHSALTDGERLAAWREAYSGRARIVLGTRSAVFAPLPRLGLIVVDEEHDASFKQHEGGFRYSARDLAVVRAQRAGIPVVLGSATPSLETLHNIDTRRYVRLSLPHRAAQSAPPRVHLVDLRAHGAKSGLSTPVIQAIERHLGEAGQVLVYLNRRGYAPTLICTACGWIAPCADCDARMTVHLAAQRLRCHHCGADTKLPERCPQCGFAVKPVGQGTERIAESLGELFPGTALVRLDRDVVRRRGDMQSAMQRVASGEARILVGTQMVTKGHDFPDMTLVVVLNADQGLFSTDFRAPERLAQTIIQVAGRAGRGARPGEVLIQTEFPEHPLLKSLIAEGYEGFARTALLERAEAGWPPFSRLAAVRGSATRADAALEFLRQARRAAGQHPRVKLLGPVPAAMGKRAGRYHAQLLIESVDRGALHRFLGDWLPAIEQLPSARSVRWDLDIDPIELF